ncbi:Uncharacterised protein [Listeria grayi]|uniref:Uncharacterized protein n=1 Tax=Listeria grayi TaxID=1641 RepID=A0A378MGI1_LISGR|nr:Uncharacterised protein [Listeria grayi]
MEDIFNLSSQDIYTDRGILKYKIHIEGSLNTYTL